jgi:hypothetical protein
VIYRYLDCGAAFCTHLGLWQIKARPRPVAHAAPQLAASAFDDWPTPIAEDYLTDSLYSDF